ncbi:MAG: hypothetical protein IPQ18_04115 [Saprospiraceae bacterium]|nr:hypothetical protein [Saprospiraceae bacterium]
MIQTMHIGDFKARFSDVVELVKKGITIKVVKGKSNDLVGYFGHQNPPKEKIERKLGFFSNSSIDIKMEDLEWSEEDLRDMGL